MSTSFGRETAKIYQFPRKFRANLGEMRPETKHGAVFRSQPVAYADVGGAWYHEAALQDVDRGRKP